MIEDCHIGLGLLLALKDVTSAKELFLQLPRSLVSLQLAAYYFALLVCMDELPPDERHAAFFCDPHKLQSLDCGVDSLRFSQDEQYRQDSILGLAMTDEEEQFELAMSLAEKYDVPLSHLAVARLSHLLLGGEEYHNRLLCFFLALQKISDGPIVLNLPPSQHVKLLMKIKSALPGIDYKILVSQPKDVLSMLRPILTLENINLTVKLIEGLPPNLGCTLQAGTLFRAWIHKLLFTVDCSDTEKEWASKLDQCREYLNRLSMEDLTELTGDVSFSEEAYKLIPLKCRLLVLKEILQFCRNRQQIEEWGKVTSQLQQWTSHLSVFENPPSVPLQTAKCRELFRRLQLSKGDQNVILDIREEIIRSDVPFSTVEYLFSLQPSSYLVLSQYLLDKLQEAKQGSVHPDLPKDLSILKQQLSPLGADPNLDPASRLQALRLMQLTSVVQEEDVTDAASRRALYTTQAILESVWPGSHSVEASELLKEEVRNKLFTSLMEHSQLECCQLWVRFVEATAALEEDNTELFELLQDIFKTGSLPLETMLELLNPLPRLHQKIALCLMSDNVTLHSHAVSLLQSLDKSDLSEVLDKDLLEKLVLHKLVAQVVPTAVYPHLMAHLLLPEHDQSLKSALRQLVKAGLQAEASTLYCCSLGLPASLSSFSTALGIFPVHDYS
ncbi:hypothetical protein B566_EDAN009754 [Ephemera danica]|nr:hypothetical protein B566_EDAN009754 [Ephemera danica]